MRMPWRPAAAPGRAAPPVPDDQWRPLMRAFGQQLGLALNPERARAWAAGGWRPADVAAITAMSAAAVADGSCYGRQYGADTAGLRHRLGEVAVAWYIHCRLTRGEVLGWLAVLAGAPSAAEARAVQKLIDGTRQPPPARGAAPAADVTRWRALPVDVAPVAWAAGLSAGEAAEQQRHGTADVHTLQLLAGLRGFRLALGDGSA